MNACFLNKLAKKKKEEKKEEMENTQMLTARVCVCVRARACVWVYTYIVVCACTSMSSCVNLLIFFLLMTFIISMYMCVFNLYCSAF